MRRWHLWTVGGILATAATLVGITLFLGRNQTFAFLDNQEPTPLSTGLKRQMSKFGVEGQVYSFQAKFPLLKGRARSELEAEGYEDLTEIVTPLADNIAYFARGNVASIRAAVASKSASVKGPLETVVIMRDLKWANRPTPGYQPAQGWVTVSITRRGAGSIFDTFRSWLGF